MSLPTVAIVEDQPEVAEMLAEMMRLSGFETVIVPSSLPAIELITRQHPALVILDVMMPDVSGLEVLRSIRRDPALDGTPVIIVSAMSLSSDIKTGLAAGASAYLTKPVDYFDLKRIAQNLIAG